MDTLTVTQLRQALAALDPAYDNHPVQLEGCDCIVPAVGIILIKSDFGSETPYLLIESTN